MVKVSRFPFWSFVTEAVLWPLISFLSFFHVNFSWSHFPGSLAAAYGHKFQQMGCKRKYYMEASRNPLALSSHLLP